MSLATAAACTPRPPAPWITMLPPAERVGLHVAAQLGHPPGHLVAEDPAVFRQAQGGIAAPEVQVGAAHVGEGDLDEDGVGLDVGQRQLADLERFARAEEDRRLTS